VCVLRGVHEFRCEIYMRCALSCRITHRIAASFGRTFRSDLARVKNLKRKPLTLGLCCCGPRACSEQRRYLPLCGGNLVAHIKFTPISCFKILSQICISIDVIHRPLKDSVLYPLRVRCAAGNDDDVTKQHRN